MTPEEAANQQEMESMSTEIGTLRKENQELKVTIEEQAEIIKELDATLDQIKDLADS